MDRHAPFRRTGSRVSTRRSFLGSPLVRLLLIAGGVQYAACAEEIGAPSLFSNQRASLQVEVSTRFEEGMEEFGPEVTYTAFVLDQDASNNKAEQPIAPNGKVVFTDLGTGWSLTAGIKDLPSGCDKDPERVDGRPDKFYERDIHLKPDELREVAPFYVFCRSAKGSLLVTITGLPTGAAPIVTVSGTSFPPTAVGGTGQTVSDLPPGDYQVAALPVEQDGVTYLPSPVTQTVTVVGGQTATATVQYGPTPATLTVDVTGLPTGADASVTVSGPDGSSLALQGSTTLDGLAPGTYVVAANTVTVGGTNWQPTPLSQSVELASGATATATVDYAEVLGVGSLDLLVTGMPPGWDADVVVTDPAGGTVHLTGPGTLTDLAPGVYTVTAAALVADYRMEPEATSQDVVVTAGEAASVEVSYLTVSGNLLVDPSFEIGLVTVATPVIPETTGEWHGDLAGVTGEENGIEPADGLWMLHFIASGPFGAGAGSTGSEMYQLLEVPSELADAIAASIAPNTTASVAAQALFNRVAGDPATTDNLFTVDIFAFDGAPADARAKVGSQDWLARQLENLNTDADPLTWQPLQSVVAVPSTTTVLLLRLLAAENVKDDATDPEFDGHYVDDASLVIRWKRTF